MSRALLMLALVIGLATVSCASTSGTSGPPAVVPRPLPPLRIRLVLDSAGAPTRSLTSLAEYGLRAAFDHEPTLVLLPRAQRDTSSADVVLTARTRTWRDSARLTVRATDARSARVLVADSIGARVGGFAEAAVTLGQRVARTIVARGRRAGEAP